MHCPTFAFALAVPSVWNTLPTALWEKSFKTYCLSEGFLELPVFATIPGWPPPSQTVGALWIVSCGMETGRPIQGLVQPDSSL